MNISLNVQDSDEQAHRISLSSMASFQPENISERVNSLQLLLEGRKTLKDVLSLINNSKKLRTSLLERVADKESIDSIKTKLAPLYQDSVSIPCAIVSKSE